MEQENKFIGILFECCNVYRRVYVNKEKNAFRLVKKDELWKKVDNLSAQKASSQTEKR